MKSAVSFAMVVFLASIFALGPFSVDTYLPALPLIAADLNTETAQVALTVSIFVASLAIGQLIGGPLSDRLGRRNVILLGMVLFIIGSLIISQANDLFNLCIWRVLQALGAGIAGVCVPAIIRDKASGQEAARLFTLFGLVMMVAPSIAPSIGTLILNIADWRWIFISVALFAALVAIGTFRFIPRSATKEIPRTNSVLKDFTLVFKNRDARPFLTIQIASFVILLMFLSNASQIYIEGYGISEELFSILFILNTGGNVVINRLNAYLLKRYRPQQLLKTFVGMQAIGIIFLLAAQLLFPESLSLTVAGFVIILSAAGGIIGNATACFMTFFPNNAGTASALMGAGQSMVGAIWGAASTLIIGFGLWVMVLVMLVVGLYALQQAYTGTD